MADNEGFESIVKTFIFIGLFAVLCVAWAISFSNSYDTEQGQDADVVADRLYYSQFESQVQDVQDTAETWRTKFESQNVFLSMAGLVLTGIFDVAKLMVTSVLLPFKLIGTLLTQTLGIPQIVVNVMTGLIIITILFGIWRLVKSGY